MRRNRTHDVRFSERAQRYPDSEKLLKIVTKETAVKFSQSAVGNNGERADTGNQILGTKLHLFLHVSVTKLAVKRKKRSIH